MNSTFDLDCKYSKRLMDKLSESACKNSVTLDFALIKKAIYFAKQYHDGQYRKSGEPFYTHPLEVAYLVSDYSLKTDVIIASILHDVIEDTQVTIGMILDNFGWRIAEMVDMLTRDRPDGTKLSVEQILENAYKKNDKEVLLIKLIDRLHNIQTISVFDKTKQQKVKKQTLIDFLPLTLETEQYKISEIIIFLCATQESLISQNLFNSVSHELL